jgi:uncharacterized LabA/DUF88 family protein
MIRYAHANAYDKAYLLSSDTDLVDAVAEVQRLGKKVVYVGSPKNISHGLSRISDHEIILRFSDIEPFAPEKPPSLLS